MSGGAAEAPPSWRERAAAARYLPRFFRLVWETHRALAAGVVALRLLRALVPVAALWAGKLIVDAVVASARGTGEPGAVLRALALEAAVVAAGELLARASQLAESLLGDLFSIRAGVRLMEHASRLDLAQFEDPALHDHLERARLQTTGERIALVAQVLAMGQDLLTLAALGAAAVAYDPVLALLLGVAVLPAFAGETHFAALGYSLLFRQTPERRRLNYLRALGASPAAAKEVQMFGLAGWLAASYGALAERFYRENRRLAVRRTLAASGLALLSSAAYYGAYAAVALAAARGALSVGELTFLAGSFARSRDLAQRLLLSAGQAYEQGIYLRDLFAFFALRPRIASRAGARAVPRPIREGFVFEEVSFRYPGSGRWALRRASFRLRAGECVALVGENGAGKTTVTKLLARLYDPAEGRITLDGVDLREYDVGELRRTIGVIFQDFLHYELGFAENIGVGRIEAVRPWLEAGEGPVPDPVREAARQSLADTILPRLPDGWRQRLGRSFDGGVELSGGEWQKVALARAYMRMEGAQALILDEPTAALDARAEAEVFARFRALSRGRTAVLVSHRFSTVRMADRVVVLSGGRVVEDGCHDELVERGGLYAELFEMQAAGYR